MNKDIIYREDAIKATWQEPTYTDPLNVLTEVRDRIEAIPSADRLPTATDTVKAIKDAEYRGYMKAVKERPQGEWIGDKCSCCGSERAWYGNNPPYCPDCGCRMKGADDE